MRSVHPFNPSRRNLHLKKRKRVSIHACAADENGQTQNTAIAASSKRSSLTEFGLCKLDQYNSKRTPSLIYTDLLRRNLNLRPFMKMCCTRQKAPKGAFCISHYTPMTSKRISPSPLAKNFQSCIFISTRAHSSVGRAAHLQCEGRRFKSCWVHRGRKKSESSFFFCLCETQQDLKGGGREAGR